MSGRLRLRPARRQSDDERILPLINVVFLLLIFVMVSSSLTTSDPFNTMPPNSVSEADASGSAHVLIVAADGRLALDGEAGDDEAIFGRLAVLAQQPEVGMLHVQADGAADSLRVLEILKRSRALGVSEARLVTVRGGS